MIQHEIFVRNLRFPVAVLCISVTTQRKVYVYT